MKYGNLPPYELEGGGGGVMGCDVIIGGVCQTWRCV